MKEALFWERTEKGIRCNLCPHLCTIAEGKRGICSVRENREGTLYSMIYGRVSAAGMDPIEKKPLYHFHPGSQIFSVGTLGCNMKCPYCQNWSISQSIDRQTDYLEPDELVRMAGSRGSTGIAYTYSEPLVWYEYMLDSARLARKEGLKNVLVTNGYIMPDPLIELMPYVDAMNIDLKNFRDESYRRLQKGSLKEVLDTIEAVYRAGIHLELTTLIVTDMNDNMDEIDDIINFIAGLDPAIPWHISRYYPQYKYDKPATNVSFMKEVYKRAVERLYYVYGGNLSPGDGMSDTVCPSCGAMVVNRKGYRTDISGLDGNRCASCGKGLNIRSDG